MPLIQVDLLRQNDKERLKNILDTIHQCAVEAFEIPERDRYQIVNQHEPEEMILLDTGLGFERTQDQIVVRVTSKQRTQDKKELLYSLLCTKLKENCRIDPCNLLVSIVENGDADWSFGFGKAQFLTGDL
ncbi:tautomerase family protein [Anaerostipes sp.]|uniref:tautomerase family protein n=1 Tax=Anaerostipes sp. TaxID=1872530 RepID=UPI0025BB5B88|nr:tautomerase family protein [Anaerostipes sp.]MBS7009625.1 tautomerase family protein [Anaerostipes sp.]